MSVQETSEIRDLTADELDAVAGGFDPTGLLLIGLAVYAGGWVAGVVGMITGLWDDIFG